VLNVGQDVSDVLAHGFRGLLCCLRLLKPAAEAVQFPSRQQQDCIRAKRLATGFFGFSNNKNSPGPAFVRYFARGDGPS